MLWEKRWVIGDKKVSLLCLISRLTRLFWNKVNSRKRERKSEIYSLPFPSPLATCVRILFVGWNIISGREGRGRRRRGEAVNHSRHTSKDQGNDKRPSRVTELVRKLHDGDYRRDSRHSLAILLLRHRRRRATNTEWTSKIVGSRF